MSKKVVGFDSEVPRRQFVHYDNSDSVVDCSVEPSMTLQSDKDACDINIIVGRAEATGFAAWTNSQAPQWGLDVSDVTDYKTARDFVMEAEAQFMQLPAKIRNRFDNDAGKFLAFIDDQSPEAIEEGRRLGIYSPAPIDAIPLAEKEPKAPVAAPGAFAPGLSDTRGSGA